MARKHISTRERFAVSDALQLRVLLLRHASPAGAGSTGDRARRPRLATRGNEPWNLVAACAPCNAGKAASSPSEALIAAAVRLYAESAPQFQAVQICTRCRRPWIPDLEDEEPSDECWPCIRAWCDGWTYVTEKGA